MKFKVGQPQVSAPLIQPVYIDQNDHKHRRWPVHMGHQALD